MSPIPADYICPITHTFLINPVGLVSEEGKVCHIFSLHAALEWLSRSPTCPLDRKKIALLKPQDTLAQDIASWVHSNPEHSQAFNEALEPAIEQLENEEQAAREELALEHDQADSYTLPLLEYTLSQECYRNEILGKHEKGKRLFTGAPIDAFLQEIGRFYQGYTHIVEIQDRASYATTPISLSSLSIENTYYKHITKSFMTTKAFAPSVAPSFRGFATINADPTLLKEQKYSERKFILQLAGLKLFEWTT